MIFDFIIYVLYLGFKNFLKYSPLFITKPFLFAIARLAYYIDFKHRKITLSNLDFAYKDTITKEQKIKIAKGSYLGFAYNLYHFINSQKYTVQSMLKQVTIHNEKYILDAIKNKQRVILIAGHYGSWEFAMPFLSVNYKPLAIISKPIKNKFLNKEFNKTRDQNKIITLPKRGSLKHIMKTLKEGNITLIVIDQSIRRQDGDVVEFFGKKVTQTYSPIVIASKMGAIVLPAFCRSHDINKQEIFFEKPLKIEPNISKEKTQEYSQQLSDLIEKHVRKKPQNWFWQHRRFKEFYPEIYTNSK